MSIAKIFICIFIAITFIISFIFWKHKKFKNIENYGALLLFFTTLFGLIFLGLDKNLISTEHDDIFYFIELGIYVGLDLIITIIYFLRQKTLK